jgi:hypothetical protein
MGSTLLALAILLFFVGLTCLEIGYKIPRVAAAVTGLMERLVEGLQRHDSPEVDLHAEQPSVRA